MKYAYYEPVRDKIYISWTNEGESPNYLPCADDGEHQGSWFFTKQEYRFWFLGAV